MSDSPQFDLAARSESYLGVWRFPSQWVLHVFGITAGGRTLPERDILRDVLGAMLESISQRMSAEFEYGRFGFAIAHLGHRGTCLTTTHFGTWGATLEVYQTAWYRYGHDFGAFQRLDDVEPAACWFELARTLEELRSVHDLAMHGNLEALRDAYMTRDPLAQPGERPIRSLSR